jgi:hypothetical protein
MLHNANGHHHFVIIILGLAPKFRLSTCFLDRAV